jgi:hypothetical protein
MGSLSSLKEIDDFQKYKQFIKTFILENESLFRVIYFLVRNPMDELNYPYPENPYKIFTTEKESDTDNHGVVLFSQKNVEILNYGTVIILINFDTTKYGNSGLLDNLYITIRIICKSDAVEDIEDSEGNIYNRASVIAEFINNEMDDKRVGNIGKVKKIAFKPLDGLNEGNFGYVLTYKARNLSNRMLDETNNY